MKLLSSEWLKTKRTAVRWLAFCMPVIYALLIVGYIALRKLDESEQMLMFQIFFVGWTAFFIPLIMGILSGFTVYQEELAGDFNGFLSSKVSRHGLYLGKLALLILTITASTFITTIGFGVGLKVFLGISIGWPIFIAATLLVIAGMIPVLTLQLWASFAWGMGASIGISIGGLLMGGLMGTTSLGDKIWQFIPWAWPVRLAKLPGTYLLITPDMHQSPTMISGFVLNQLASGLTAVTVCFVAALIGGILWFNRWEGRKSYE